MTKEELEKEAYDYADKYWGASPCVIRALKETYINSAEPREKRIAELEKENAELKKELKISQRCWQDQKNISLNANCSLHKAKEIIKDFILMAKVEHLKDRYETVDEAEQFLNSEVVK